MPKWDEEKLGTRVTYVDPLKSGGPITLRGVTFPAGEAVDLAQVLDEDQAKAVAKKLAGNASFKVDGGPDHAKLAAERAKEEEAAQKHNERAAAPSPSWKPPESPTLEHAPKRK